MEPVPIVEITDNQGVKKFIYRHDVVDEILMNGEVKSRKIVVLSIIGEYRKGKSCFLGYCLRFMYANYASVLTTSKPSPESASSWFGDPNEPLTGFKGKSGHTGDTKGILLWPDVFLHDANDEKIAIILMDTQGLFETGSTEDENAKIFGLSTLISSMQILNLKEVIHEHQIEYLEIATNLTKFISQTKKSEWKPFQKLLFLVRDWVHEEIGYDGGEKYLNEFLNAAAFSNIKTQSVRKNIRESFDSIKCFLLNHPGLSVTKSDFNGEWGKLDKEFNQNLKILIESLLLPENLNKKSIFGKEVTGAEFRDCINGYFEAFRASKLPDTENIFETMANNQMKAIIDELIEDYKILIGEDVDFECEDFEGYINDRHENSKSEIISKFKNFGENEDIERVAKFQSTLVAEIEKCFETWRQATMREHQIQKMYKEKLEEASKKMANDEEKIAKLEQSMQQQFEENERILKQNEEERLIEKQMFDDLNNKFNSLLLENQEKEQEVKKVAEESQKEIVENIKNLQITHELEFKSLKTQMEEKSNQDRDKMEKNHQRDLEKMRKAAERDRDEQNKRLKIQRENQRRKQEEERLEREKEEAHANLLRKNFSELGDDENIKIDILKFIANIVDSVSKRSLGKGPKI